MQIVKATLLSIAIVLGVAQAAPISGQGTWESTLKARDINGNAVALNSASAAFFYDTTLNITWLANMNASAGTAFTPDGRMSWGVARSWAEDGLIIGGFDDWRLPKMLDTGSPGCNWGNSGTDCGYNVQTKVGDAVYSELAHLFYVTLGNLGAFDTAGNFRGGSSGINWGLTNTAFFQNMQSNTYWSGLELATNSNIAWIFNTDTGGQHDDWKFMSRYATAVRTGDVLRDNANNVPEPHGLALAMAAMFGLGFAGRRRMR